MNRKNRILALILALALLPLGIASLATERLVFGSLYTIVGLSASLAACFPKKFALSAKKEMYWKKIVLILGTISLIGVTIFSLNKAFGQS